MLAPRLSMGLPDLMQFSLLVILTMGDFNLHGSFNPSTLLTLEDPQHPQYSSPLYHLSLCDLSRSFPLYTIADPPWGITIGLSSSSLNGGMPHILGPGHLPGGAVFTQTFYVTLEPYSDYLSFPHQILLESTYLEP